jgi:hypothetical protein
MMKQQDKNFDEVECPECGHIIPISEALRHQLTKALNEGIEQRVKRAQKESEEKLEKERAKIATEAKKQAEESVFIRMRDMEAEIQETKEKLRESEKAELELLKKTRELEEKERNIKLEATREINSQKAELQKKVTAGILRDTFVVRCMKRGEAIENVLIKIGLSAATGEDAKEKYLKLAGRAI